MEMRFWGRLPLASVRYVTSRLCVRRRLYVTIWIRSRTGSRLSLSFLILLMTAVGLFETDFSTSECARGPEWSAVCHLRGSRPLAHLEVRCCVGSQWSKTGFPKDVFVAACHLSGAGHYLPPFKKQV